MLQTYKTLTHEKVQLRIREPIMYLKELADYITSEPWAVIFHRILQEFWFEYLNSRLHEQDTYIHKNIKQTIKNLELTKKEENHWMSSLIYLNIINYDPDKKEVTINIENPKTINFLQMTSEWQFFLNQLALAKAMKQFLNN